MDPVSLHQIISLGAALQIGGPILAVMIIWWVDRRDIQRILALYREDMQDMRRMYESNVILVRSYQALSGDLKDIVILNSTAFQRLDDDLKRKCAALKDN